MLCPKQLYHTQVHILHAIRRAVCSSLQSQAKHFSPKRSIPLLLVFCGIIYLVEAASVMIQVLYFKATHGKRIFKMSPIHHHYEMSGWSEDKICLVFSLVTFVFGALSVMSVYFAW